MSFQICMNFYILCNTTRIYLKNVLEFFSPYNNETQWHTMMFRTKRESDRFRTSFRSLKEN